MEVTSAPRVISSVGAPGLQTVDHGNRGDLRARPAQHLIQTGMGAAVVLQQPEHPLQVVFDPVMNLADQGVSLTLGMGQTLCLQTAAVGDVDHRVLDGRFAFPVDRAG